MAGRRHARPSVSSQTFGIHAGSYADICFVDDVHAYKASGGNATERMANKKEKLEKLRRARADSMARSNSTSSMRNDRVNTATSGGGGSASSGGGGGGGGGAGAGEGGERGGTPPMVRTRRKLQALKQAKLEREQSAAGGSSSGATPVKVKAGDAFWDDDVEGW